jgi:hypothetical protein
MALHQQTVKFFCVERRMRIKKGARFFIHKGIVTADKRTAYS